MSSLNLGAGLTMFDRVEIRVRKSPAGGYRPWAVSFGGAVATFPTGIEALDFVRRLLKAAQ